MGRLAADLRGGDRGVLRGGATELREEGVETALAGGTAIEGGTEVLENDGEERGVVLGVGATGAGVGPEEGRRGVRLAGRLASERGEEE